MNYLEKIEKDIIDKDLKIIDKDFKRPWGGFIVIDENDIQSFKSIFFPKIHSNTIEQFDKLSPKILILKPRSRLSWQYHYRREEIWMVYKGNVGVVVSDTDDEKEMIKLSEGDQIKLKKEQRHRLIGLNDWSVIAEIWQHTEKDNPSDEDDIVRISDDYGR